MNVAGVIDRHPLIVSAELKVNEAIAALSQTQTGCILIVSQEKFVGIFTNRDVVELIATKTDWQEFSLAEIVSPSTVYLEVTALPDVLALMSLMHQQQLKYLPIVTVDSRIYGLVTLESMAKALEKLAIDEARKREALSEQLNDRENLEVELQTNERALQLNQERVNNILSSIEDVVWSANPQNFQLLYLNAATEKIYGRSISEFLGNSNLRRQVIVSEDRLRVEEAAKALYSLGSQDIEYRIVRADGAVRWVRDRARLILDSYGNPIRIDGIITDITDRKQAQQQLERDALYDSLTGLANRSLLMKRLQQAIERSKSEQNKFAILFLDIDRFKLINDSLGHSVGDYLLIEVAHRLKECRRNNDLIARLGGDEFVLLLEEISDRDDVIKIARRIQQVLQSPIVLSKREVYVSISIGIVLGRANLPIDRNEAANLLRDADTAMYYAKAQGQGKYEIFTPSMHIEISQRLNLEHDLRRAIERQEFLVYYQPIICLPTETLWGFEALVRWQQPQQGIVSPNEFIPLAEQTGLSIEIDRLVLNTACCQLRLWQEQLLSSSMMISVNLSAKQFYQSGLIEVVDRILSETGLKGNFLKLEITESVLINNTQSTIATLEQLHERGIQLCLDDFGTGYSSLSYLQSLPFDFLKIDRSFVERLKNEAERSEIIRAIIALGSNLKIETIAEGIETKEQLRQLIDLNCTYGQGFWFAKPMNSEAATDFIDRWNTRKTANFVDRGV